MAENALWVKTVIQSSRNDRLHLRDPETGRTAKKAIRDIVTDGRGNARDYLLRRIARDRPDLLPDMGMGGRIGWPLAMLLRLIESAATAKSASSAIATMATQ